MGRSAAIAAHGPGFIISFMLLSYASRTSLNPGSAINGVPASETRATFFPNKILLII